MSDVEVIVVLGKGVRSDGTLPLLVQHTLDYAVSLNRPIIVSGAKWGLSVEPQFGTEAAAMAHYLVDRTTVRILQESRAKDTIGNLLLSKQIIDAYGWKTIHIVTSAEHLPRTQLIAERVFHSEYHLQYHGHEHLMPAGSYTHILHYEWWAKQYDRWILRTLPSDCKDPLAWLERHHFMYSNNLWSHLLRAILKRPKHR